MGAQVRLWARKRHYLDHLQPVWDALPESYKLQHELRRGDRLLLAGGPDVLNGHPYIYMEHGAGQSYIGFKGRGYSGAEFMQECELFLCPNQEVADRWQERYPDIPVALIGCPRLDPYHTGYEPPEKTIAITFHFDLKLLPETRSAFSHYRTGLRRLVQAWREQGWTVLGHAHPRWPDHALPAFWRGIGVRWTSNPLRDASVLAADNTSLQAEFLSCSRPVIALNAPWYRRDVWHGGRFWDWPLVHVETVAEASGLILDELVRPIWNGYAVQDGTATALAVHSITRHLDSL